MSFVLVLCVAAAAVVVVFVVVMCCCYIVVVVDDDDDVNVFGGVDGLLRVVMAGCPGGLSVY